MLPNLPENYLYDQIPEGVIAQDTRSIIEAVVGGYQERLSDIRSYIGGITNFYDPQNVPPVTVPYTTAAVLYTGDVGQQITTVLDLTPDAPTDPADQVDLITWAAAQAQISEASIISVTLGTDVFRSVTADILDLIAANFGATLYTPNSDDPIGDKRKMLEYYFPRLKIKGTVASFDVLGRSIGLTDSIAIPLWGRLSPRNPSNIGDPSNNSDFTITPEIVPSATLPDPIYDPWDHRDGAFYTWESSILSPDPNSPYYFPTQVNGKNPYITLVATGTYNSPVANNYVLANGAPNRMANVPIIGGNFNAVALAEGASWNGLTINVAGTVISQGTYTVMTVADRLSRIKYRTSYYDLALAVDIDTFGTLPVQDNAEVCTSFPSNTEVFCTSTSLVGSCGYTAGKPLTGSNPRVPALASTPQLDLSSLTSFTALASKYMEDVRPATRLPRQTLTGFSMSDTAAYAPYASTSTLVSHMGGYAYYTGSATGYPIPVNKSGTIYPSYSADIMAITNSGTYPLTAENIQGTLPYPVLSLNGSWATGSITGTYSINDASYAFNVSAGPRQIVADWAVINSEVIQPTPTGYESYSSRPEDELQGDALNLYEYYDDFPWRRDVNIQGELVDLDIYTPKEPDLSLTPLQDTISIYDQNSVAYNVQVFSKDITIPSLRISPIPTIDDYGNPIPAQPYKPALAYDGSGNTYMAGLYYGVPVAQISAFQIQDQVGWFLFNENPEDPLTVNDYSAISSDAQGSYAPSNRSWDAFRGWNLTVNAPGVAFASDAYRALTDQFGLSFWINPSVVNANNGDSLILKLGPYRVRLGETANTVTFSCEDTSFNENPITTSISPAEWNFIVVQRSGNTLQLGTGDQFTATSYISQTFTNLRGVGSFAQKNFATTQSGNVVNYTIDLADYGVDASQIDVTVGGANWTPTSNLLNNGFMDTVYQVFNYSGLGNQISLVFGDGVHGAAVPTGAAINIQYGLDDNLFIGLADNQAYNISDVRIFNVQKTVTEVEQIRIPQLTPTAVKYPVYYFYDLNESDRYSFGVLACGLLYPTGIPIAPELGNLAIAKRYDISGKYTGPIRQEQMGIGDGHSLPPVWTMGDQGRNVQAGAFVYSGSFTPLPGINQVWLNTQYQVINDYAPGSNYTINTGYGSSPITGYIDYTFGWSIWQHRQDVPREPAVNPTQNRFFVQGDDEQVYAIYPTYSSGSVSLTTDGPYWEVRSALEQASSGETYLESPSDSMKLFSDTLSVSNNGSGVYDIYTKRDASLQYWPDIYLYLRDKPILDSTDTIYSRWLEQTNTSTVSVSTAGIISFLNPEPLPAGTYNLTIDSEYAGIVDDQFLGFNVEVTIGAADVDFFGTLLTGVTNGVNVTGTNTFQIVVPQAIVCPWTLTLNWTNPRVVNSRGIVRTLQINGYQLVLQSTEMYRVDLPSSGSTPVCTYIDVTEIQTNPENPNQNLEAGGWIGALNSYGTTPVDGWTHESLDYSESASSTEAAAQSKNTEAFVWTMSTENRREDLFIPIYQQPDYGFPPVLPYVLQGPPRLCTEVDVTCLAPQLYNVQVLPIINEVGSTLYYTWTHISGGSITGGASDYSSVVITGSSVYDLQVDTVPVNPSYRTYTTVYLTGCLYGTCTAPSPVVQPFPAFNNWVMPPSNSLAPASAPIIPQVFAGTTPIYFTPTTGFPFPTGNYFLNVTNGTGEGWHAPGTSVTVTPSGSFSYWSGDTTYLSNPLVGTQTFTMPPEFLFLTAN